MKHVKAQAPTPSVKLREYRFGVQMISLKLRSFVVRSSNPEGIILYEETDVTTHKEATKRAEEMLLCYGSTKPLVSGCVAYHSDSQGHHQAIVLRAEEEYAHALFFTSNPLWGQREATDEEIALAGIIQRRRTYLAPVVRPKVEFTWRNIMYPQNRVQELWDEFEKFW